MTPDLSKDHVGVMYYHTFSKLADHRWIEEKGYIKCIIFFYLPVQRRVPHLVVYKVVLEKVISPASTNERPR